LTKARCYAKSRGQVKGETAMYTASRNDRGDGARTGGPICLHAVVECKSESSFGIVELWVYTKEGINVASFR